MAYKFQGFGGGGPLSPMTRLVGGIVFCLIVVGYIAFAFYMVRATGAERLRCAFDRNELGPMGAYGQWWWDIYKCADGTERRVLVAGPRG